jgi:hypothetical protein
MTVNLDCRATLDLKKTTSRSFRFGQIDRAATESSTLRAESCELKANSR